PLAHHLGRVGRRGRRGPAGPTEKRQQARRRDTPAEERSPREVAHQVRLPLERSTDTGRDLMTSLGPPQGGSSLRVQAFPRQLPSRRASLAEPLSYWQVTARTCARPVGPPAIFSSRPDNSCPGGCLGPRPSSGLRVHRHRLSGILEI